MKKITLLFSFTLLVSLFGQSLMAGDFGSRGRDGSEGIRGLHGQDGKSVTLKADGSIYQVDLSGLDGEDARHGEDGDDASFCSQPHGVARDLEGADGGDGGEGGRGGDGGNAGRLVVYYKDAAHLKKVRVYSSPGEAGRGGQGGDGGYGCRCSDYSWSVDGQSYRCESGHDGRDGEDGLDGHAGSGSAIYLIPQLQPLPSVTPKRRISIEEAVTATQFISKKNWKREATNFSPFSSASRIRQASFYRYMGVLKKDVQFVWRASRHVSEFTESTVDLYFRDSQLEFSFSKELWTKTTRSLNQGVAVVTIDDAVLQSEATQLEFKGVERISGEPYLVFEDLSDALGQIDVELDILFKTKSFFFYKTRFKGKPFPGSVTIRGNKVYVNLGALKIKSKYLKAGKKAKVEVRVLRSFGVHQYRHSITKKVQL